MSRRRRLVKRNLCVLISDLAGKTLTAVPDVLLRFRVSEAQKNGEQGRDEAEPQKA